MNYIVRLNFIAKIEYIVLTSWSESRKIGIRLPGFEPV